MPRDSCRIAMKRYCSPGVTLSTVCSAHCPLMVFLDWAQMTGALHLILVVLKYIPWCGKKLRAAQAEWNKTRGRIRMNLKEGIRAVCSICVTLTHQCHTDSRGAVDVYISSLAWWH